MKKKTILMLMVAVVFIGCKTNYYVDHHSKIVYGTDPGYDKKNAGYLVNDSLHLKIRLDEIDFLNLDTVTPFIFNDIQRFVLKRLKVNRKRDIILFSNYCEIIIKRNVTSEIKGYRAYSVFDTTISKNLYDTTLKKFYRKSQIVKNKKLYLIEDVFQTTKSTYSFIYFGQNETKGGNWYIDPTNPDDILCYTGFYKHSLDVTKWNAKMIMEEEIDNL